MMDTNAAIPTDDRPAKPPMLSKAGRTLTVTRKVKAAIEAMVWQGLKRSEAAASAGLKDHALYVALRSPHVKMHYLAECEVLRTSGRARRIHRLEAMLEQDDNKAAVINAALALDRMEPEQAGTRGSQSQPGLTIVINTPAQPQFKQVGNEPDQALSITYDQNSVHGP
jgi:hypothetical protein